VVRLVDRHGRSIDYLRISVTDRCNLRCRYCMPPEGIETVSRSEILSYGEILRIARAAVACGFVKFRLTGGEPLLRAGVIGLARDLHSLPGLRSLTMTTNGVLLERYASDLIEAGVKRVNVSLDALDPGVYREITRGGNVTVVLKGIETARRVGFDAVKINVVIVKGLNEDQIPAFVRYSTETGLQIRFIEKMPFPGSLGEGCSGADVRRRIEDMVKLVPRDDKGGPRVRAFDAPEGGRFAFISPMTDSFCLSCNRLRLTATGMLRQCLMSEGAVDLRSLVREHEDPEPLEEAIRRAVRDKPLKPEGFPESAMNCIGG